MRYVKIGQYLFWVPIILLMNKSSDQFFRQSPSKLLTRALIYSKNLRHHHDLPKSQSKSMVVHHQADQHRQDIEYAIKQSKYQIELFRRNEAADLKNRSFYQQKIAESATKVQKNGESILEKKQKEAELYNKHVQETYSRYTNEQKRHRESEKEKAYKLRKELVQFYKKQQERRKQVDFKQVSVGTCYQSAVNRINNIHRQNEEYSLKAELQLAKELNKNNHYDEIIVKRRRALSSLNQSKSKIFNNNNSLLDEKEARCIQKYANNEEGSLNAWKHIEQECSKSQKRLQDFFKTRKEKWLTTKTRVDAAKQQVPKKCLDILDKTSKSFFRHTVSSFKNSAVEWSSTVKKNKSAIREVDEQHKDQIMDLHLDLRLKNKSSVGVVDKMLSMRQQARKLAYDFV